MEDKILSFDEFKAQELADSMGDVAFHKVYTQVLMKYTARVSAASTFEEIEAAVEWFEANEPEHPR